MHACKVKHEHALPWVWHGLAIEVSIANRQNTARGLQHGLAIEGPMANGVLKPAKGQQERERNPVFCILVR
jgi:hypothetical protein